MSTVDWRFPTLLIAAMLLGLALTYLQMRTYNSELNRALRRIGGQHLALVSGRGRSWRGGAILIAIVDILNGQIVSARAMTGATVFARFRDLPALQGPVGTAVERVTGKQLRTAVEMALAQLPAAATGDQAEPTPAATAHPPRDAESRPHRPGRPNSRLIRKRPGSRPS